jgi:hypothetical protein
MRSASRVAGIALATLLTLFLGGQSLHALEQEAGTAGQQSDRDKDKQDSTAGTPEANKKTQSPEGAVPLEEDSSKTDKKVDGKAQPRIKSVQARAKRDAASTSGAADKKVRPSQDGKSAGTGTAKTDAKVVDKTQKSAPSEPSSPVAGTEAALQTLAKETLQTLDVAIAVAKNAQVPAPLGWQSKAEGVDPFLARTTELRQRAEAAKDAQAWLGVAREAAASLGEVLRATAAHSAADTGPAAVATRPADVPLDAKPSFAASRLPLYLAALSFVVSLLAVWSGWFVARREINKALVEAGLL